MKPSALRQSSRIFLLRKRGSFEPGHVYLGRASLSPCSLAADVFALLSFFLTRAVWKSSRGRKQEMKCTMWAPDTKGTGFEWVYAVHESVCVCELWVDLGGPSNPAALHENNVERSRKSGGICSPPEVQYSRLTKSHKKIRVGHKNTSCTSDYLWIICGLMDK